MTKVTEDNDRSGTRHHDKFRVTFEEVGETWSYSNSKSLRKLHMRVGDGELTLTLHGGVSGKLVQKLGAHSHVHFENEFNDRGKNLTISCDKLQNSGNSIYVHAEWNYNG